MGIKNKNFISAEAANIISEANTIANPVNVSDNILKSTLFSYDIQLQDIGKKRIEFPISYVENQLIGSSIEKIQKALLMVLPELVSNSSSMRQELEGELIIGKEYTEATRKYLELYQQTKNLVTANGQIDSETILSLDLDLIELVEKFDNLEAKIKIKKPSTVYVGKFFVVFTENYPTKQAPVYYEPVIDNTKIKIKLNRNTRVFVDEIFQLENKYWALVKFDSQIVAPVKVSPKVQYLDGSVVNIDLIQNSSKDNYISGINWETSEGYILLDDLWIKNEMPDAKATLYSLSDNETISNVIQTNYPDLFNSFPLIEGPAIEIFCAMSILFANNPQCRVTQKRVGLSKTTGVFNSEETTAIQAPIYVDQTTSFIDTIINLIKSILNQNLSSIVIPTATNGQIFNLFIEDYNNSSASGWNSNSGWHAYIKSLLGIVGNIDLTTIKLLQNTSATPNEDVIWLPSKDFLFYLYNTHRLDLTSAASDILDSFQDGINNFLTQLHDNSLTFDQFLSQKLDENWPIGTGVAISKGLGATFGIPVGFDSEYKFYIYRKDANTLLIRKKGTLSAGLDLGVGYGFFLGNGKKSKSTGNDNENKYGAGVEAFATAQAQAKIVISQEFEFKLKEDWAILNLIICSFSLEDTAGFLHGLSFISGFKTFNLDPMDYLSKITIEAGSFVKGIASAGGGLRIGQDPSRDYYDNNTVSRQGWELPKGFGVANILRMLNASLTINASIEIANGIEIKLLNRKYDPNTWIKLPSTVELALYTQGSIIAEVTTRLGPLSVSMPFVPNIDIGGGVKFNFVYHYNDAHFNAGNITQARFEFKNFGLFIKSGSVSEEDFEEKGYYVEFIFENNSNGTLTFDDINFDRVEITKRMGLNVGPSITDKGKRSPRVKQGPKLSKIPGFQAIAYVQGKFVINMYDVTVFINDFIQAYTNQNPTSPDPVAESFVYLLTLITPGVPIPKDVPKLISDFIALVKITEFKTHWDLQLGLAFGIAVAEAFKARIQASAEITFFSEYDYLTDTENRLKLEKLFENENDPSIIVGFLTSAISTTEKIFNSLDMGKDPLSDWNSKGK